MAEFLSAALLRLSSSAEAAATRWELLRLFIPEEGTISR